MTQRRSEKLTVAAEDAGERLDRVLAQRVAELSRSRHKALILGGRVAIDGATIRDPGHRVNAGERIMLELPPAADAAISPESSPIRKARHEGSSNRTARWRSRRARTRTVE